MFCTTSGIYYKVNNVNIFKSKRYPDVPHADLAALGHHQQGIPGLQRGGLGLEKARGPWRLHGAVLADAALAVVPVIGQDTQERGRAQRPMREGEKE